MSDCGLVSTPLEPGAKLLKGNPEDQTNDISLYQSLIGSLMYACVAARPDLAHTVTLLSQFSSCPNDSHLTAAKYVLRYFKGTTDLELQYPWKNDFILHGYTDPSYGNFLDGKSCSGHALCLGKTAISWCTKKKKCCYIIKD